MDKISIIVPCYNEEDALPAFTGLHLTPSGILTARNMNLSL